VRDICVARLPGAPHICCVPKLEEAIQEEKIAVPAESTLFLFFPDSPRLFESVGDSLNDLIYLRNDLMVPDSQHCVSRIEDKLSSTFIVLQLVSVLRAIELDNKFRFKTKEVSDKRSD
jgi:hypothetical protein